LRRIPTRTLSSHTQNSPNGTLTAEE
jgi:hypothetical protein